MDAGALLEQSQRRAFEEATAMPRSAWRESEHPLRVSTLSDHNSDTLTHLHVT